VCPRPVGRGWRGTHQSEECSGTKHPFDDTTAFGGRHGRDGDHVRGAGCGGGTASALVVANIKQLRSSGVSCSVCATDRRRVNTQQTAVTDLLVLRLRCLGTYHLAFYHRILPATSRSPKVERHLPHLSSTHPHLTHTQVALRQRTKSAEGKHGKTARECRDEALPYLAPPINMATNVCRSYVNVRPANSERVLLQEQCERPPRRNAD